MKYAKWKCNYFLSIKVCNLTEHDKGNEITNLIPQITQLILLY